MPAFVHWSRLEAEDEEQSLQRTRNRMQKLVESCGTASGALSPALGLGANPLNRFLERGQVMGLPPRLVATMVGLLFICLVGALHLWLPRGLSFEFFYLLGCALCGWAAGTRAAAVCAGVAGVFACLVEVSVNRAPWQLLILFWNVGLRVAAFCAIGWLAARVSILTRGLEQTVEQRTTRLESEVEKHKETSELLGEAIQLFKQVTENITDVFWVTDAAKSRVEYVSPAFEWLWGKSCESLQMSPSVWFESIHHEDRERVIRAMLTKQTTGEYDEEYRVVHPDGALRWVHDRAFPVKNAAGAVYRIVGITEDITERKRTEHLLRVQRDFGVVLSSTSDLRYALERLLDLAVQLEGIDCGGLYLLQPETGELHLEAHRGLSGSFINRISRYQADATEVRLAQTGRVMYVRHDQIPRTLEVLWGKEGLRALAVVPVQHRGEVLGMLNLASYRHDEILPKTRLGIEMIASQLAGAIARIRAEESLRQSEAHLRTLINSAPIALIAADSTGAITFEDGRALAAMGAHPGEHVRQPMRSVYRDFPELLANVDRALAGETFSSVVEFGGTVFECRYTPMPGPRREPAGFITVAIDVTERLRLQRQILEISDREQARIGQDIHDGLCQQLIGLAFKTNSLAQTLEAQRLAESAQSRKICALLDESITESRRVCRGLYPIRLSTHGLVPALLDLASTATERYQIPCVCDADEGVHCDMATATHLYRIAQEALNNALKHSQADRISLQLKTLDGHLVLRVEDNGKGLGAPRPAPSPNSGMGRHIMDYRARLIGGAIQFNSDSHGTVVDCHVPLSKPRLES